MLQVGAGVVANINDVVLRDGVAAPQGGGILNSGVLSLDQVVVHEQHREQRRSGDRSTSAVAASTTPTVDV